MGVRVRARALVFVRVQGVQHEVCAFERPWWYPVLPCTAASGWRAGIRKPLLTPSRVDQRTVAACLQRVLHRQIEPARASVTTSVYALSSRATARRQSLKCARKKGDGRQRAASVIRRGPCLYATSFASITPPRTRQPPSSEFSAGRDYPSRARFGRQRQCVHLLYRYMRRGSLQTPQKAASGRA